jgi:hypothetical protein
MNELWFDELEEDAMREREDQAQARGFWRGLRVGMAISAVLWGGVWWIAPKVLDWVRRVFA